jgi:ubiquinone/menaquinone biosynthesis C-methylase UbiE
MFDYYDKKLSADRLKRVYEIAPPRVQQYLQAEIKHVLTKIQTGDIVLELGCGYGRIIPKLVEKAGYIIGIDTSLISLQMGNEQLSSISNCNLIAANALQLPFPNRLFDAVICIQNGISAFHVDWHDLFQESIRVTKSGGIVLFSSYSEKFWNHRLEWFRKQSEAGLLGELDEEKTGNGVIVCKDGFTGTSVRPNQFLELTAKFDVDVRVKEIDESSLFCEMIPH